MDISAEGYKAISKYILKCWEFECGEDCPWYDWDGEKFRCERYKSFDYVEQFFKDALEALEKE